jgi:hypothetical protein
MIRPTYNIRNKSESFHLEAWIPVLKLALLKKTRATNHNDSMLHMTGPPTININLLHSSWAPSLSNALICLKTCLIPLSTSL